MSILSLFLPQIHPPSNPTVAKMPLDHVITLTTSENTDLTMLSLLQLQKSKTREWLRSQNLEAVSNLSSIIY
jgi:hypothetical protein